MGKRVMVGEQRGLMGLSAWGCGRKSGRKLIGAGITWGSIVGKGSKINFCTDVWCKGTRLSHNFPHLYAMASHRNATMEEMWDQNFGKRGVESKIFEGL